MTSSKTYQPLTARLDSSSSGRLHEHSKNFDDNNMENSGLTRVEFHGVDRVHDKADAFFQTAFILPSRLTHTRFKPRFHRWGFAHFMCGIPVTTKGVPTDMISIDDLPWLKQGWFRVEADDHLERAPHAMTLRGKLDMCLSSHGISPRYFPYCYLITPPRFLGFPLFNAVSLWFLYSDDLNLEALLVEVHNSSQERRSYLLHDDLRGAGLQGGDCPATAIRTDLTKHVEFTCEKVFHTNAFTSRSGIYSTRVADPLQSSRIYGSIDATITLKSNDGPTSLVARLVSRGVPIDPSQESIIGKIRLLCQCTSTMTLMFPQAMLQMYILRFVRRVKLHRAPIPLPGTVSRPSTHEEVFFEGIFRQFLIHATRTFPQPVKIHYESPEATALNCHRGMEVSSSATSCHTKTLERALRILTPSFYTNVVRYPSIRQAIESEIVKPDYSAGTIQTDDVELVKAILEKKTPIAARASDRYAWSAFFMRQVARLRSTSASESLLSSLDDFVLSHCNHSDARKYIWYTFTSTVDERSGVGLIHIKLWSLVSSMMLGVVLSTASTLHGRYLAASWTGYCLAAASVILWFTVVSKEDLAKFLII